ncbi:hypothetical protein THAOC_34141 [Thalassiosira oceanica]|uniref:Uncharacterized protein n=1 Tax=Thalassiosira oceanica TaxID=159749 RepID=K0RDP6_THAOC|nr:hypothetical protein THAOC_34141 [Thalassiosira oceanica]|eukprot:EJK47161.1 hypothetical protein THAOC_34141 [Thalassiosira oceanica]
MHPARLFLTTNERTCDWSAASQQIQLQSYPSTQPRARPDSTVSIRFPSSFPPRRFTRCRHDNDDDRYRLPTDGDGAAARRHVHVHGVLVGRHERPPQQEAKKARLTIPAAVALRGPHVFLPRRHDGPPGLPPAIDKRQRRPGLRRAPPPPRRLDVLRRGRVRLLAGDGRHRRPDRGRRGAHHAQLLRRRGDVPPPLHDGHIRRDQVQRGHERRLLDHRVALERPLRPGRRRGDGEGGDEGARVEGGLPTPVQIAKNAARDYILSTSRPATVAVASVLGAAELLGSSERRALLDALAGVLAADDVRRYVDGQEDVIKARTRLNTVIYGGKATSGASSVTVRAPCLPPSGSLVVGAPDPVDVLDESTGSRSIGRLVSP